MWFSACELGVFLATGDSCVRTEPTTKVFSGKGIAMMYECKRLLNHSTAADGLLLARSSTQRTKATSMDAFLVPQSAKSDVDADSDATEPTGSDVEHDAEREEMGDATDSGEADDATEKAEHGAATEYARGDLTACLLYTSPSPRDKRQSRMPSSA